MVLLINFLAMGAFVPLSAASAEKSVVSRKESFKVEHYKIKSKSKSNWDAKTGILKLEDGVVLTLSLADQTTAYLTCDQATENRLEGKGDCWGNSQFTWQDLKINSDHAAWDLVARTANFDNHGVLVQNSFMNGRLDMSFDKSNANSNADTNQIHMDAFQAKGVWTPRTAGNGVER